MQNSRFLGILGAVLISCWPTIAVAQPETGTTRQSAGAEIGTEGDDRITLRSGTVVRGSLLEDAAGQIRMMVTQDGVPAERTYKREYVAEVERAPKPEQLCPLRRSNREVRATTASSRRARKNPFSDKWMLWVMDSPQRIAKDTFYPVRFSAYLDPKDLKEGMVFGIEADEDDIPNFGPMQEGGGISQGLWFEAKVLHVKQGAPSNPRDKGGVIYEVMYLVMPHPNGREDSELAIPIKAVTVSEIRNDRFDPRDGEQDAERLASSIGQLVAGIDGYFTAGAAQIVISKLAALMGNDQSPKCYFRGLIKKDKECFVRIDEDAIF